jgi:methylated-DNA-[protein]-cysteine S-methyltransferase
MQGISDRPFPPRAFEQFAHAFATGLGWIALEASADAVLRLSFGHGSPAAALRAMGHATASPSLPRWVERIGQRLSEYASGRPDGFEDVPLSDEARTTFCREVLAACRTIPYGQTLTYRQLAARVGRPAAARAVGQVMASNRLPILVPCHRVVGSSGGLGGYSGPQGIAMKRRLLELEGAVAPARPLVTGRPLARIGRILHVQSGRS